MTEPQDGPADDGWDEQPTGPGQPPAAGVPEHRPADDQEAIDRAFAELIAQFQDRRDSPAGLAEHATTDDPGDQAGRRPELDIEALFAGDDEVSDSRPADEPASSWRSYTPPEQPEERYIPPPAPWPHPSAPVLLGWIGIAAALVVMLAAAFGLGLPSWAGWLAVASFVAGFGVLISRLPRRRPPGSDDDGAVL
jgi:hypothetical protein